jgi:hypothetical protein
VLYTLMDKRCFIGGKQSTARTTNSRNNAFKLPLGLHGYNRFREGHCGGTGMTAGHFAWVGRLGTHTLLHCSAQDSFGSI